jgi:hypothetical protein
MAQRRSIKGERQRVLEILTGIGPDVSTAEFLKTFELMMLAVVRKHEIENRIGSSKELRAATNRPSLDLLVALFKLQPALWDPDRIHEPVAMVRPMELAKLAERELSLKLQSDRTLRMIEDTLEIFKSRAGAEQSGLTSADVQKSLIADRTVRQPRETLKKALMGAAVPLSQLGLVRMQTGTRGKAQHVTAGLSLTPEGAQFVSMLFRHSVSASADHHPAFRDDMTTEPGSDS